MVLANKSDLSANGRRRVDSVQALNWAAREKVRLFEVSSLDRQSLYEPFIHLASRWAGWFFFSLFMNACKREFLQVEPSAEQVHLLPADHRAKPADETERVVLRGSGSLGGAMEPPANRDCCSGCHLVLRLVVQRTGAPLHKLNRDHPGRVAEYTEKTKLEIT